MSIVHFIAKSTDSRTLVLPDEAQALAPTVTVPALVAYEVHHVTRLHISQSHIRAAIRSARSIMLRRDS
jgi:hypothetical protein